jgi:hypothetical protein
MSFLGKVGKFLTGGIVGGLLGLTKKKTQKALPAPTRDDAEQQAIADDELRRRRGASADMLTGTAGAEAALGATGKFNPTGS